jgi:hypothetical protein
VYLKAKKLKKLPEAEVEWRGKRGAEPSLLKFPFNLGRSEISTEARGALVASSSNVQYVLGMNKCCFCPAFRDNNYLVSL